MTQADESHRAVTSMYDLLFEKALEVYSKDLFPICGLTATPGRSHITNDTYKLVKRFETYLIKPDLGEEYEDNPLAYFRKEGYLAKPKHILFHSGREYNISDDDLKKFQMNGISQAIVGS